MSLSSQVITSSWAECSPITVSTTQTVYTTVWTTNLLAANEFSTWDARYTITEVRTGNPDDYVRPAFPPCFVETSVHCGACADAQDIIITAPAPTMTEDVTIDGDGVVASAALGLPADADFPAPTGEVQDMSAPEEFPPTEPQDIQPDIAGGAQAPSGAATIPDDAEFRGAPEDVENFTVADALGLTPEATGEADPAITAADDLSLAPEATADPALTVADALGLTPEAAGEDGAIVQSDPINDIDGETETVEDAPEDGVAGALGLDGDAAADDIETETTEDGAADALDVPAAAASDAELDPSLTVEDILPLLSGSAALPETTGDAENRIGADVLNEDEALEAELQGELSDEELATLTVEATQSLFSTVVVPAASESVEFRTSADSEDTEEDSTFGTTSTDDDTDSTDAGSSPAPDAPEESGDGFIVTAAATRTPTQSTTLLAVNALVVGLWVLL